MKSFEALAGSLSPHGLTHTELARLVRAYGQLYRLVTWSDAAGGYPDPQSVYRQLQRSAEVLSVRLSDGGLSLSDKARFAALLMEVYQGESDFERLDRAIRAAYEILDPDGREQIVVPADTPEIAELLIGLDYFVPDDGCGARAATMIGAWMSAASGSHGLSPAEKFGRLSVLLHYRECLVPDGEREKTDRSIGEVCRLWLPSGFTDALIGQIQAYPVEMAGLLHENQSFESPVLQFGLEVCRELTKVYSSFKINQNRYGKTK